MRKTGKQIGLADCYIAVIAHNNNVGILTLDKHFIMLKDHVDIILL
ncbi:MAG: hypothetical protein JXJ04_19555 [Spirochaetales bacterium]|nr:hypothetical protein [Spirochaetales bacterium]